MLYLMQMIKHTDGDRKCLLSNYLLKNLYVQSLLTFLTVCFEIVLEKTVSSFNTPTASHTEPQWFIWT